MVRLILSQTEPAQCHQCTICSQLPGVQLMQFASKPRRGPVPPISPLGARACRVTAQSQLGCTAGNPHCCAGFTLGDGDTTLFITFSQENMAISHNSIAECFLQASSQRLLLKWGFECVIPSLLRKSTQLQPSTYTRLLLTLIATSCLKYPLPICPPSPPTSTQVEILLLRGSQYFMKY